MTILLGVTGGISAYKACTLINILKKDSQSIRVVMTENAKRFITPLTLATLSQNPVIDSLWQSHNNIEHIELARWADIFVIYPATANIISKFANGIADDIITTTFLALKPQALTIIFPAMNTYMYNHEIVKQNIQKLQKTKNVVVTSTKTGHLACGSIGEGCLLSPQKALAIIREQTEVEVELTRRLINEQIK